MTDDEEDEPEFPPLSPGKEMPAVDSVGFVSTCLETLKDHSFGAEWLFGASLLTQSDKWGLIWRADFRLPGESNGDPINRIICWGTESGELRNVQIAIGQDTPPLHTIGL